MDTNVRFIKKPNFPEQDVALAAMSCSYPLIHNRLNSLGIEVLPVAFSMNLPKSIASHADINMIHMFEKEIIVNKKNSELIDALTAHDFDIIPSEKAPASVYPGDILLNALFTGNKIIGNIKNLDKNLLKWCEQKHIERINVRQGYTKCSVAIIDETSIITADDGICKVAKSLGLQVLKITPGHILLEGYPYGFIGGCCGLIGKNKIAFTGCLEKHPDGKKIRNFILTKNIEIVELTDKPLIDLGGILPLKEYTR